MPRRPTKRNATVESAHTLARPGAAFRFPSLLVGAASGGPIEEQTRVRVNSVRGALISSDQNDVLYSVRTEAIL